MTEKDRNDLAKKIAEEMKKNQPEIQCPHGITAETAQGLKDFVSIMNTGKKAATRTIVTIFITAVIGLAVAGFWSKIEAIFKK